MLVKKDGTWTFCVDYYYLNDLTVKGTFPIPAFNQLMDELSNACWFSNLDLFAGYHQVGLKASDEHKTAFSTHSGHYEFKVMAFGLTGAPNTFESAMNITLAPLFSTNALLSSLRISWSSVPLMSSIFSILKL